MAAKDGRLVAEAAAAAGLAVPLSNAVQSQLELAEQLGCGAEEMAAVYRTYVDPNDEPAGSPRAVGPI